MTVAEIKMFAQAMEHLRELINERQASHDQHHVSEQRALKLQADEYERRLTDLNHAHDLAQQKNAEYLPRDVFETFKTSITEKLEAAETSRVERLRAIERSFEERARGIEKSTDDRFGSSEGRIEAAASGRYSELGGMYRGMDDRLTKQEKQANRWSGGGAALFGAVALVVAVVTIVGAIALR